PGRYAAATGGVARRAGPARAAPVDRRLADGAAGRRPAGGPAGHGGRGGHRRRPAVPGHRAVRGTRRVRGAGGRYARRAGRRDGTRDGRRHPARAHADHRVARRVRLRPGAQPRTGGGLTITAPGARRLAIQYRERLIREALAACLAGRPEFVVVGQAADLEALAELCRLRRPEIALVDGEPLTAERIA